MKIVLDTSIIVQDHLLSGHVFKILLENLDRAGHSLFTPEVVLDEAVNRYRKSLVEATAKFERSKEALRRLLISTDTTASEIDVEVAVREYELYLRQRLYHDHFTQARTPGYPEISHKELVARAHAGKKPFSEKDTGYKDALIWHTVLWIAEVYGAEPERIAFISANASDFGTPDGQLHPDLVADLVDRDFPPHCVLLFRDLKSFVQEHISGQFERLQDLKLKLNRNEFPGLDFQIRLLEELRTEIQDRETTVRGNRAIEELRPVVKGISELLQYTVADATRMNTLTDSTIVLDLTARTLATVQVDQRDLVSLIVQTTGILPNDRIASELPMERVDLRVIVDFTVNVLFYEKTAELSLELNDVCLVRPSAGTGVEGSID